MAPNPDDYFSRFDDFDHDPQASLLAEFNRLALDQDWDKRQEAQERSKCLLAQAQVHIGSIETGGSEAKLGKFQDLCEELRVSPIPTSISQCKKVLRTMNVNLIDLIDSRRQNTQVQTFSSYVALRQYTRSNKRFFPLVNAKRGENEVLRILLRKMR